MSHGYLGTILVASYFVFGAAWIPIESNLYSPSLQSVTFKECHTGCKPGTGNKGQPECVPAKICNTTTTINPTRNINSPGPSGGTGPNKPAPPNPGGTKDQ